MLPMPMTWAVLSGDLLRLRQREQTIPLTSAAPSNTYFRPTRQKGWPVWRAHSKGGKKTTVSEGSCRNKMKWKWDLQPVRHTHRHIKKVNGRSWCDGSSLARPLYSFVQPVGFVGDGFSLIDCFKWWFALAFLWLWFTFTATRLCTSPSPLLGWQSN